MFIFPSLTDFNSDIFSYDYTADANITIIFISEGFSVANVPVEIDNTVIQLTDKSTGKSIRCPSIIGMGNDLMRVVSDDPTLQGQRLSPENLDECYVEIYG